MSWTKSIQMFFFKLPLHKAKGLGLNSFVFCVHSMDSIPCEPAVIAPLAAILPEPENERAHTYLSLVTCHISLFTCHMSCVTCHLSHFTCYMSLVTWDLSHFTCHMSLTTCNLSHVSYNL